MYLESGEKNECYGCEACVQACGKKAVRMIEDKEGFRYPQIDSSMCVNCGQCQSVCPYGNRAEYNTGEKYVWGGWHLNPETRFNSTSGGAFTAIVEEFCDEDYVIFGAGSKGLRVFHSYITDKNHIYMFQKSKYVQSVIGYSYKQCRKFLKEGKKVLFSGTPCQVAGLKKYLRNADQSRLLTVEVICEGVPSPLYMRKYDCHLRKKYGYGISEMDYRYTGKSLFSSGKWDFEIMRVKTINEKIIKRDRWFNPFWDIWLNHLMSRPSCYTCQFAKTGRVADITLGDLWGVHLYCPELYGNNGGSSLVICNTAKGKGVFKKAAWRMHGHELKFEDALKYQGPMRKNIGENPLRGEFMRDLAGTVDYKTLNKKWAGRPAIKLLVSKYIGGNRQRVALWKLRNRIKQNYTAWREGK